MCVCYFLPAAGWPTGLPSEPPLFRAAATGSHSFIPLRPASRRPSITPAPAPPSAASSAPRAQIFARPVPEHCSSFLTLHAGWVYMEDQVPAFERKYAGKHSNCSCCRGQTPANHLLHRKYIVILVYRKIPPGTLFPRGVVADTAPRLCSMLLTTRV